MAYHINIQEEDEILLVEITGNRTQGNVVRSAKSAWEEVAKICAEKGLSRILVISNATGKIPAFDAYEVNTNLDRFGIQRGWKIAFVNLDTDSNPDLKFAETIAVNRGFIHKLFRDEDEARTWLAG